MAQVLPAKRPRGLTDHHRASIAGSSRNKRPRHSVDPSEQSYSEIVEPRHDENEDEPAVTQDTQKNEDEAYLRQTQRLEKSLRESENQKNVPAEAGIIEEIRCTNFMCHDQLTVPLGPLINFIIGHNGSGKSAVLTALTICLGGKASATNRGQNLQSFIKNGRDHANLAVKIKNQGVSAYKPDQFGDSIIVERHFIRSGGSGFKLKDRNGKIVSQKKADVEDVIDAFAMQLDNPMNVLTQDLARQFLNSSTPKDKYKFFLKGTQLEALDNDYKQIDAELEEQEARAQTTKGDLDVFKKNFELAVAKARRAKNLTKMREKENELAQQAAWAQVEGLEEELASIDTELAETAQVIANRKGIADDQARKYAQTDESLERAQDQLREFQAEMQPTQDELKEKKDAWGEVKKRIFALKADERKMGSAITASEKSVHDSQSNIKEHKARQAQADNGQHAQKLQEHEEAKTAYEERRQRWETHDEGLPALNDEQSRTDKERRQTSEKIQKKRMELNTSNTAIRALEQDNRNWMDSYRNAPLLARVLDAIKNESRFREKPVGPMGRHVELLRPEWGSILEKQFGQILESFVVTSKADQVLLSDITRRLRYDATIYLGNKRRINANEPDSELLTWMRALKINNELVRNQLIVNQMIEQTVLIQKRSEAWDFMSLPSSQRQNVKMCFCMSDGNRRKGHNITISGSGGLNLGFIDPWQGAYRMQADKGPQISDEKENMATIQQEIRHLEASFRAAQDHLTTCQAKVQDHKRQKKTLKIQMDLAQEDMYRLEGEVNDAIPDAATIEQLEKELADAQGNLRNDEDQFGDLLTQLDEANGNSHNYKRLVEELEKRREEYELRVEKLKVKVTSFTQRREQALRSKNKALDEVQAAEVDKVELEKKRTEHQKFVDSDTEAARQLFPQRVKVPENETFESLNRKLERLKEERQRSETELGGSEEELLRAANAAKFTFEEAAREMNSTETVRRALVMALKTRRERWLEFRKHITSRARIIFNYLLSERQFRGALVVNHEIHALDIIVQPDITVQNSAGRQTKTLSGGEKSFSTICLLLALWDAMGSSIRCLDEFDVYMDQVNRDVSMTLIIGAARRAIGRQYVLITPQSMNNKKIHSMDDVKIIRMEDPERGQTALNFSS